METTELVMRRGMIEDNHAFDIYGSSAAAIVTASPELETTALRLKIEGPEKVQPPGGLTVRQAADWLKKLQQDGYALDLTDAEGHPVELPAVE